MTPTPPPAAATRELSLEIDATAPRRARRFLASVGGELPGGVLDDACLLVSELVTNAVRHGGTCGPMRVRARVTDDTLRVEVVNPGGPFAPGKHGGDADQASGWGLQIVDRLARRWGVSGRPTVVWFELAAT